MMKLLMSNQLMHLLEDDRHDEKVQATKNLLHNCRSYSSEIYPYVRFITISSISP